MKLFFFLVLAVSSSAMAQVDMFSVFKLNQDIQDYQNMQMQVNNIPGVASDLGLTSLVQLVVKAKLVDALSAPGPLTLFGPTNNAFAALPQWLVDILMKNETILAAVLTYHVVPGNVFSSQIRNELQITTVEKMPLRFNTYGSVVTAQCAPIDTSRVDNKASNGVVHVLNGVMLPPYGDIVTTVVAVSDFKTLVTAVEAAGLVDTLKSKGPFTLFAPTDAAFAKLSEETLNDLLKNKTALTAVLTYHVVSGTFCSAGLKTENVPTVNGADVSITVGSGGVSVNNAHVISADASVTNGVIHVIDTVLLPPNL